MTNHPRRAMKVEVQRDTLQCPSNLSRTWTWDSQVTVDGRTFIVTQKSMTGAFDKDTARQLVEAYLDGTLKSAVVTEV